MKEAIITLSFVLFIIILTICVLGGYRSGQIDYANGVIKYHLVKQIDGSVTWHRK